MSTILTPVSLWKNFEADLDVMPVTLGEKVEDSVRYEYVNFSGRDTGMGRVCIFGVLATNEKKPSNSCVLVLADSDKKPDEALLAYFVKNGFSALCVDYAGMRRDGGRYTVYPDNVYYANLISCGRRKDFVDETADKTCWYEWVGVGMYAKKYLCEKFNTDRVGLVGILDGGEVAWKLAYADKFACLITINACGWLAYRGLGKFQGREPDFDEERYRYMAAIDSQAYAPYVRCPVLILCSASDPDFDSDRAYDTFSRINPEFIGQSSIAFSINCGSLIDFNATKDMLLFLDNNVEDKQMFLPRPPEVTFTVDAQSNLVARVICDNHGIIDKCGVFFAADNFDYATRDWCPAPLKKVISTTESEHFLNVFEDSSIIFVLCNVVYSNGFTVWSKIATKRVSGKFRNSRSKSKIIYNNKLGAECFTASDCSACSVSDLILTDADALPQLVTMNGLSGVYSKCNLTTHRIFNPEFLPTPDAVLKFDMTAEEDGQMEVQLRNYLDGNVYSVKLSVLGGVWQSTMLTAKTLKNSSGISLKSFDQCDTLTFIFNGKHALNNLIWL